jgi:hypothetical protein
VERVDLYESDRNQNKIRLTAFHLDRQTNGGSVTYTLCKENKRTVYVGWILDNCEIMLWKSCRESRLASKGQRTVYLTNPRNKPIIDSLQERFKHCDGCSKSMNCCSAVRLQGPPAPFTDDP